MHRSRYRDGRGISSVRVAVAENLLDSSAPARHQPLLSLLHSVYEVGAGATAGMAVPPSLPVTGRIALSWHFL